jgi:sporulation protein YlmC with PRC-barrel domain
MVHYGTLKDFRFAENDADDIRGAAVYGIDDEKLGKLDDVIFDHSTGSIRYAVVDTGGWLSSKKFVIPADRLRPSSEHEHDYQAGLTKEQIESFPPYNEKDVESDQSWKEYEDRYSKAWDTGPVQHREGTDRNVTPTTEEVPAPSGSAYMGTRQPILDTTPERVIPPTGNEVEIPISGSGIGARWSTFEEKLRRRRREATLHCVTCGRSLGSETASDRERDEERKAS